NARSLVKEADATSVLCIKLFLEFSESRMELQTQSQLHFVCASLHSTPSPLVARPWFGHSALHLTPSTSLFNTYMAADPEASALSPASPFFGFCLYGGPSFGRFPYKGHVYDILVRVKSWGYRTAGANWWANHQFRPPTDYDSWNDLAHHSAEHAAAESGSWSEGGSTIMGYYYDIYLKKGPSALYVWWSSSNGANYRLTTGFPCILQPHLASEDLPVDPEEQDLPPIELTQAPTASTSGTSSFSSPGGLSSPLFSSNLGRILRYQFYNATQTSVFMLLTHEEVHLGGLNIGGGATSASIGFQLARKDAKAILYEIKPNEPWEISTAAPKHLTLTAAFKRAESEFVIMWYNLVIRRGKKYTFEPSDLTHEVAVVSSLASLVVNK
ncbi:MAG: hypothetical protein J0H85_03520, partial [Sediminibacterium magnilacihabitans]|nr:hypothetical protein [Sediminibacterium magnilacihabitans]